MTIVAVMTVPPIVETAPIGRATVVVAVPVGDGTVIIAAPVRSVATVAVAESISARTD